MMFDIAGFLNSINFIPWIIVIGALIGSWALGCITVLLIIRGSK